ncbi:exopolysaccharide biosynthesis protein [Tianweitania sp. BSSL-BM11]|uniref:Exopolysaccharide biosynthesis protein n=1 Tax=Tianweitania aestuarii TaxID=2814886 RepID=A0ABS5RVQ8_9HYPH|nr:exopolysaccharide biosynthesis protein [Tianweitania aestuarii]MBS9721072.1 exopolysaccharide biosynthesis protein [Tianweitania aestuarii]
MNDKHDLHTMKAVLKVVSDAGSGDQVSLEDVVREIGDGAFAPLLLVPALIAVTPASGIPGLSSVCGITIAIIAFQLVIRRKRLWLPQFLLNRTVSRTKLDQARDWLNKPAGIIDRLTARRLAFLVRYPFSIVPALICLMIGLVMPILEFIPFSGSVAAGAVSLFALSLVTKDGLLAILGSALVMTAGYFVWRWLF